MTLTTATTIIIIVILSIDDTNDNDTSFKCDATLKNPSESGRNVFSGLPFVFQAKAPALEVGILRVRPE